MTETTHERRTKRRYAHELYPHPAECEYRPLDVEVRYWYAQVIGYEVNGTGWMEAEPRESADRMMKLVRTMQIAMLSDALLQGMTGEAAWEWVAINDTEYASERAWSRAAELGIDADAIRPYRCGPVPTRHPHLGEPDRRGMREVTYVDGTEDDCPVCTEPVEASEVSS